MEGWSTTIEEAKALSTHMLLSDIPIHREQAPDALFFNPHSVDSVATALKQATQYDQTKKASVEKLRSQQNERIDEYATNLYHVIKTAAESVRK